MLGPWEDEAEIITGTGGGPELEVFAAIPVRNVGNGTARISRVVFRVERDHYEAEASKLASA